MPAGDPVLVDRGRARRLEKLDRVLADRKPVEVAAHRVVDRIGVVGVAEAVLQLAAGELRADGERPLVHEDVFPERRVVPELVVDVGGKQQIAVHQAAVGPAQADRLGLTNVQVVVRIAEADGVRES